MLLGALLLQIEILPLLQFRGAQLSLVLILVVWYGLRADWMRAAAFGLAAGICEDALGAQTGAAWTIATTATAVFASVLSRRFFFDSTAVFAGVVLIATLLRGLLFWTVMALQGYPPGYARLHFHETLWSSLINTLFVAAFLPALRALQARRAR
jgi:rod shape-determining protein MreD